MRLHKLHFSMNLYMRMTELQKLGLAIAWNANNEFSTDFELRATLTRPPPNILEF